MECYIEREAIMKLFGQQGILPKLVLGGALLPTLVATSGCGHQRLAGKHIYKDIAQDGTYDSPKEWDSHETYAAFRQ